MLMASCYACPVRLWHSLLPLWKRLDCSSAKPWYTRLEKLREEEATQSDVLEAGKKFFGIVCSEKGNMKQARYNFFMKRKMYLHWKCCHLQIKISSCTPCMPTSMCFSGKLQTKTCLQKKLTKSPSMAGKSQMIMLQCLSFLPYQWPLLSCLIAFDVVNFSCRA